MSPAPDDGSGTQFSVLFNSAGVCLYTYHSGRETDGVCVRVTSGISPQASENANRSQHKYAGHKHRQPYSLVAKRPRMHLFFLSCHQLNNPSLSLSLLLRVETLAPPSAAGRESRSDTSILHHLTEDAAVHLPQVAPDTFINTSPSQLETLHCNYYYYYYF